MKRDIVVPCQLEAVKKRTWVVRYFRFIAVLEFIGASIATFIMTNGPLQEYFLQRGFAPDKASLIALPISLIFSIGAGMSACALTWALAMVIDDLHAMRMYLEGFVIHEDEEARPRS